MPISVGTPAAPVRRRGAYDLSLFVGESLRRFATTGALAPSGHRLSHELTRYLRDRSPGAISVLEVGAGTGAVTRHIAAALRPDDALSVVELNSTFADHLRAALAGHDPVLARVAEQVRVREMPVQELSAHQAYDVIVSGLPFMNLGPHEVRDIVRWYLDALRPGGHLSFYSYPGTAPFQAAVGGLRAAARRRAIRAVLSETMSRHGIGTTLVLGNLPPARVYHLRAS